MPRATSKFHRKRGHRPRGRRTRLPSTTQSIPASWDPNIVDIKPMPMPSRQRVYTFQRTYTIATLAAASTGNTVNAFNFTLSALPNSSEFTSLFDQYRILEAVVQFTPYCNQATFVSAGVSPGFIATVFDYDDSNLPGSFTDLQQYDSYQRNLCTEPFRRILRPRIAVGAYSGTFTSFANMPSKTWIDAASPNVQYYGIKSVIQNNTYPASTNIYEVEATVTLQCRSLH